MHVVWSVLCQTPVEKRDPWEGSWPDAGQVQMNVSQVQGDLGTMHRMVDSLGQDVGTNNTLESSVTFKLGSMERSVGTQLGIITQM